MRRLAGADAPSAGRTEMGELLMSFRSEFFLFNETMCLSRDNPIGQSQREHSAARKALHNGEPRLESNDAWFKVEANDIVAGLPEENVYIFQTETVKVPRVVIEIFVASQPVHQIGFDGESQHKQPFWFKDSVAFAEKVDWRIHMFQYMGAQDRWKTPRRKGQPVV